MLRSPGVFRRAVVGLLFGIVMFAFMPAQGEMTISGSSNLDTLDYDIESIHLKLDKLESRWQLSPTGDGKLFVERLRAKRLLISIRGDSKQSADSGLPDRIKLPFPIKIRQAEIAEVVIMTATESYTLSNVQFDLEGDAKTLKLNMLRAGTPFGKTEVTLNVGTENPFSLTGTASVKQETGATPYDIKVNLSGNLKALHFDSTAMLALQDSKIALVQADSKTSNPAALLVVTGELGLLNDYPLTVAMHITDLHPERLGSYPAAQLNFDVNVQGKLSPQEVQKDLQEGLQVQFSSRDSHLVVGGKAQAISAAGKVAVVGSQMRNIDFQADMESNTIKASGNLGAPDSQLAWRADFPKLAVLGEQFSGELHANGTVEGAFDNLAVHLSLLAQKLQLAGDMKAEKLTGQATLMAGELGKFNAEFAASGLQVMRNPVLDGNLTVQGTRAAHTLQIKLHSQEGTQEQASAEERALQFQGILQGGLVADHWQGFIQNLSYRGETPITLQAPAKLSLSTGDLRLDNAVLQLAKGRAVIDTLSIGPKGFSSKGSLTQMALDDLPPSLLTLPPKLTGNPVFSGKWDINADEAINGSISFWRESGDLAMTNLDGTTKSLGLQEVKAELLFNHNDAEVTLRLLGQQLGSLNMHATTTLTKTASGFSLMARAPLVLTGDAQLNTLAWLPLPASLDASSDGTLTMTVQANGTVIKPNLRGNVMGKNLQLSLPSSGVALTDGTLDATFEDDRLRISQAAWKGGEGYLRTSGTLLMENKQPKIELNWIADKFTAISQTDRLLVLSGAGSTSLAQGIFAISGDFKVVKGLVTLADEGTPTLGDDVIVLGRTETVAEPALQVLLNNLHIDLGNDFTLHGRGLDAQLSGGLTLLGLTQYLPHTVGNITVKKGTYMAYGQVLNIERGILNFNGPVDNPSLNIRAMRNATSSTSDGADITKINSSATTTSTTGSASNNSVTTVSGSEQVNAGVEITGSGIDPVIKLVSDPNVPDSEKLSWLMLGHGLDQTGKKDFALLSLAAGALLTQGQSVPLQTQLARSAGLDEFSFSGSDAETASLTFGKRLTSQLYLSYEKSISGLLDVARLTFKITPRWSIQAEAGTESAVDTLYTFSFK
ncbi:MAG: translocation/assembly module TamB domain-containing protein [Pseudomonadota bacterium]